MKKKMIVLIAFIYIASMLFCGDGVGKKLVEEKFPHLTYSDKECILCKELYLPQKIHLREPPTKHLQV